MSEINFSVERGSSVCDEIKPLLAIHHAENGNFQEDVPLAPNWDAYKRLDDLDALEVLCVRNGDNKLVGYYVSNVLCHPHYQNTLYSFIDVYFLLPEYRNATNGIRMFEAYEASMRARMVKEGKDKIVLIGRWRLNRGKPRLMEAMGWMPVEMCYTKLLKHG